MMDSLPARQGALVDAAIRLLSEEGPSAIKARTVTAEADMTTMGLYSAFGGLGGLMNAVVDEGFARLDAQMHSVEPSDDPVADLFAMAIENRRFAADNQHLYDLLFGLESRDTARGKLLAGPNEGPLRSTAYEKSFATLADACDRAIHAGRVRAPSGRHLAAQLWSLVHGFISLELSGHFAGFANPVEEILVPLTSGFMTSQGDDSELSLASTTKIQF